MANHGCAQAQVAQLSQAQIFLVQLNDVMEGNLSLAPMDNSTPDILLEPEPIDTSIVPFFLHCHYPLHLLPPLLMTICILRLMLCPTLSLYLPSPSSQRLH
jgi:hypothetical protein